MCVKSGFGCEELQKPTKETEFAQYGGRHCLKSFWPLSQHHAARLRVKNRPTVRILLSLRKKVTKRNISPIWGEAPRTNWNENLHAGRNYGGQVQIWKNSGILMLWGQISPFPIDVARGSYHSVTALPAMIIEIVLKVDVSQNHKSHSAEWFKSKAKVTPSDVGLSRDL